MSTRTLAKMERKSLLNRRVRRRHQQSPSPSPRLKKRRAREAEKNIVKLERSKSEPIILRSEISGNDDQELLFRPHTCLDIFTSHDYVLSLSPPKKSYQGDAKVVISVTVEGSPGPVRAMVKLSCNVEEAIKIAVHKYNAEGRTPPLNLKNNHDDDDGDAASHFNLYTSYFSLQSLNKSDVIGEIGSRNFHLRKRSCKGEMSSTTTDLDDKANTCLPVFAAFAFLPGFDMPSKIKVLRKTSKLWRILGCLSSG